MVLSTKASEQIADIHQEESGISVAVGMGSKIHAVPKMLDFVVLSPSLS